MNTKHRRFSLKERINEGKSKALLDRARSTISREINKWVQNSNDKYIAELAHWNAKDDYIYKRNIDKISSYNSLKI